MFGVAGVAGVGMDVPPVRSVSARKSTPAPPKSAAQPRKEIGLGLFRKSKQNRRRPNFRNRRRKRLISTQERDIMNHYIKDFSTLVKRRAAFTGRGAPKASPETPYGEYRINIGENWPQEGAGCRPPSPRGLIGGDCNERDCTALLGLVCDLLIDAIGRRRL
mgnify:CR=1 FL=1